MRGGAKAGASTIIVGSANFPENQLLAEIYAGALKAKGIKVDKQLNIGSREIYIKALRTARSTSSRSTPACSLQYFDKDARPPTPTGSTRR